MAVPRLLLKTLEDILEDDFKKFKWYLTLKISDSYKPIPKALVEGSTRIEVVTKMIESYSEGMAVQVTEDILKEMQQINAAKKLRTAYTEEINTAASTVTPPSASISAQQESVVIAPLLTNSTTGTINITINKS